MHRVRNLFPADWRASGTSSRRLAPAPLIDNVFSRGRDFRVSFVITPPAIPSRAERSGTRHLHPTGHLHARASAAENKIAMEKLRRALTGRGFVSRARARVLVSGTSAFHSRLQIPKITAVERTRRGATRHGAKRRRLEFREASRHAVAPVRYVFLLFRPFSRPFCATGSRWCLTTVLQPVRQSRRMQNLGTVTSETRETIKTS